MPRKRYIAIKISETSKENLLKVFPPRHKNVFADHVTLFFNPSDETKESFEIGQKIVFIAYGEACDEKAHAVIVELPTNVPCFNENPHITISTADGTKPFYSNEMLEGKKVLFESLVLFGKIAFMG